MVPLAPLPGACWTPLISLLLVCCLLPLGAQGQFSLRVEPQDMVISAGGSLLINCSTDCPHPKSITVETYLFKETVGSGLGWEAFQLSNVTGDSKVLCSGFCNGSQITGSSNITVYRFPKRVELAPLPPWQPVGENFTLRCQVEGGAPQAHLSAVLLRGEEELSRQLAVGESTEVLATVLAGRDDHGANFSCRWELDLRPQGLGLFQNSSAPRQLRTFVLPVTPPRLIVPRLLEVGTSRPVDCTLDGLFPASEAQVQLVLGDQMLNSSVSSQGDTLTATATATANTEEGAREIVCNVTLGGESRETRQNLTIYNGPKIDPAKCPQHLMWKERRIHVLQCQARGNPDPQLLCLQKSSGFQVPVGIPFRVTLNYSGTYFCRATSSQGTQTLTVLMNIQVRKPLSVTIAMVVLTILGFVIITAALVYVFWVRKQNAIYHVNQGSSWLPLTSKQPHEALGEEPS
ncbi:intercellular adhesion molecule 3 isoform X2 [Rousettus aegyptiacus]|uniref:intercellular adhesion molecule 3 isoform X2 n=1 Tax=Rousettus aegyptiacus TaxID=9407 RepID=UPI0007890F7F|nr:intercellular adhesion molecule 3 isoform X2 [Rousettus aegyptiacus]